jgi:molybdenum cofactor cytidylyltransferase
VVPRYQRVAGHPVGFAASCRDALLRLTGAQGAAPVVKARRALNGVADLEVDDAGIVTDIDTVQDLAQAERLLAQRTVPRP